jgi:hypothetical protein
MSERLEAERRIRVLVEEAESLRAVVGEAPGEMGIIGFSSKARKLQNTWPRIFIRPTKLRCLNARWLTSMVNPEAA